MQKNKKKLDKPLNTVLVHRIARMTQIWKKIRMGNLPILKFLVEFGSFCSYSICS